MTVVITKTPVVIVVVIVVPAATAAMMMVVVMIVVKPNINTNVSVAVNIHTTEPNIKEDTSSIGSSVDRTTYKGVVKDSFIVRS